MSTQAPSPIRNLFRSPFRNKDKPLPDLPTDQSPARVPGTEISHNAAASVSSNATASPTKGKSSNSFLAKLLGSSKARSAEPQSPPHRASTRSTTTQGSPTSPADQKAKANRSPIRKNYFGKSSKKVDVRTLSKKVNDLEAQLQEARKELNAVKGHQRSISQEESDAYDKRIQEKVLSLSQRGRFDGLVENLLGQAPILAPQQAAQSVPSPAKAAAMAAGAASSEFQQDQASQQELDNNLKRKRDVPDGQADISWEAMQKNIAAFQMQHQSVPNKRARKSLEVVEIVEDDQDELGDDQSEETRRRKKAHRDMPIDPAGFAKLVKLEQEKEQLKRLSKEKEKEQPNSSTARPQSRRGSKAAPDFSSLGSHSTIPASLVPNRSKSIPSQSPSVHAWPAPHSLSTAPSTPEDGECSSPSQPSSPDRHLPSLDVCAPHLPPSLAASNQDLYELDSDSSSISSDDSDDAATRRDRRQADFDAWRAANAVDEDEDELADGSYKSMTKPPPTRHHLVSKPSRLSKVVEEFEWDDGETF